MFEKEITSFSKTSYAKPSKFFYAVGCSTTGHIVHIVYDRAHCAKYMGFTIYGSTDISDRFVVI